MSQPLNNQLPLGWTSARLADIAEVRLGRQRSPARATGPNMRPYMRAANVTWKGLDLSDVKEMDFTPAELEIYRLEAGDILLSEASGSPREVGKPAVWRNEIRDCCIQNTLLRVRTYGPRPTFLYYHFLHDALSGKFVEGSKGVGIHHLGASGLSELVITVPPVEEQARIVEEIEKQFTRLEAGVAALKRVQANLKRYRAAVLKAACEGRLVPTEADLARAEGRSYEPADKLLERILQARHTTWRGNYSEALAADKSIMPQLPEGWCWTNVSSLLRESLRNGHSARASSDGTGIGFVRPFGQRRV